VQLYCGPFFAGINPRTQDLLAPVQVAAPFQQPCQPLGGVIVVGVSLAAQDLLGLV